MRASSAVALSLLALSVTAAPIVEERGFGQDVVNGVKEVGGTVWDKATGVVSGVRKGVSNAYKGASVKAAQKAAAKLQPALDNVGQKGLQADTKDLAAVFKAAKNPQNAAAVDLTAAVRREAMQIAEMPEAQLKEMSKKTPNWDSEARPTQDIRALSLLAKNGDAEAKAALTKIRPFIGTNANKKTIDSALRAPWKKPVLIAAGVAGTTLVTGAVVAEILGHRQDLSNAGPLPPSVAQGGFTPDEQQQILYFIQQHPDQWDALNAEIKAKQGITDAELQLFTNYHDSLVSGAASAISTGEADAQVAAPAQQRSLLDLD